MPKQQSALATEFCRVGPVTSTPYVSGAGTLTLDVVLMAFMPYGAPEPADADWHVAGWEVDGTDHYVVCLVGPANGGVVLAPGDYRVWLKIEDNPEVPVAAVDTLKIT